MSSLDSSSSLFRGKLGEFWAGEVLALCGADEGWGVFVSAGFSSPTMDT
jgi:hypothetical protein